MLRAHFMAADHCAAEDYPQGWSPHSNGGLGFGPWSLVSGGPDAGFFLGSAGGHDLHADQPTPTAITAHGLSFGLFAHSGQLALACRAFDHPSSRGHGLHGGDRFTWKMQHGLVAEPGSSVGLSLLGDELPSSADECLLFGQRVWAWEFLSGHEHYVLVDRQGIRDTGIAFCRTGLEFALELTSADGYQLEVHDVQTQRRLAEFEGCFGGSREGRITGFAVYNRFAGRTAECDLFFSGFALAAGTAHRESWRADAATDALSGARRPAGLFARLKALVAGRARPDRATGDA